MIACFCSSQALNTQRLQILKTCVLNSEPGLKYTNLRPCVQIKLLKLMLMKELHLYNTVGI